MNLQLANYSQLVNYSQLSNYSELANYSQLAKYSQLSNYSQLANYSHLQTTLSGNELPISLYIVDYQQHVQVVYVTIPQSDEDSLPNLQMTGRIELPPRLRVKDNAPSLSVMY